MDTSVNSSMSEILICYKSRTSSFIFMSWLIVCVLFLPVFISVLYIGYQRWRKQRSVSMAATHSDVFTFHMVTMEIMNVVGSGCFCWDLFTGTTNLTVVGSVMFTLFSYGQMFFHILTCLERYLAVVHPITYQSLKQVGGVRIRNLSIGCVWLLSFGLSLKLVVFHMYIIASLILDFLIMSLCVAFLSFFSFSVLYVLIRPRPGEVSRDRKLIDKSKRRALNTMMTILGALLLKVVAHLLMFISFLLVKVSVDGTCKMQMSSLWLHVPSSLVLPLLFLHRARKLPGK